MGVCAAGVALLLGHVGTANAVQGMSAPALITSNALADCTTLAGDAISWSEDLNPQTNTPNLVAAVVADDGINGPSHVTELGPSTGTAGCPVLAGAGANVHTDDHGLAERLTALSELDETDRQSLLHVLDALLTRTRLHALTNTT